MITMTVNCRTSSKKSTCSDKSAKEIVKIEQDADAVLKSEPVEFQNESAIDSNQMFSFSLLDVNKDMLIDQIEFKTGISNITDITLTNASESNADNAENIPAQTSNIISSIDPPSPNFDSYKFKMPVLKKFVKKELVEGIQEITFHCNICSYKTNVSCSLRNHLKINIFQHCIYVMNVIHFFSPKDLFHLIIVAVIKVQSRLNVQSVRSLQTVIQLYRDTRSPCIENDTTATNVTLFAMIVPALSCIK